MKKLVTACIMLAAVAMPMTVSSSLRAEPANRHEERHPQIHAALHALENAKRHLKEAKHDFGGHREAALIACDNAITQLRLALEADRR